MKKILVLCTGNACRSQMAEGYLRFFTQGTAEVTSAGLDPSQVHPLAVAAMQEDNIDISEAQSKGVDGFSGQHFDYLITVCDHAKERQPADISANHYQHYSIPDPEQIAKVQEPFSAFAETREQVKREMLRFIGMQDELRQVFRSTESS